MFVLSDDFCSAAGVPTGTNASELIHILRTRESTFLDGLLSTEEGRLAAEVALTELANYKIRVVPQIGSARSNSHRVRIEGMLNPVRVALVGEQIESSIPTDVESLIFIAAATPGSALSALKSHPVSGSMVDWRRLAVGTAIIAEPLETTDAIRSSIAGIFCLKYAGFEASLQPANLLKNYSEIRVSNGALSKVQARLLFEAGSSDRPKWRFLSFYRILENAYLASIKSALLASFDDDAAQAVDDAKKHLQSEINQLIKLASESDLGTEFLAFNMKFDELAAEQNRYVLAIDRAARSDPVYRQTEDKKAIVRFYKMRCSIAHAGTSGVIYEQLSDADTAMVRLLPSVEAIIVKSLGMSGS